MSSKAVIKNGPKEKVGNFCLVDGKVTVIEYSDLPDELAEKRRPDGSLAFQLGSIAIHIINTGFVEQLNTEGHSLPLHRAVKKIPHIDPQGRRVEPKEPNGVKLESFIFDAIPLAKAVDHPRHRPQRAVRPGQERHGRGQRRVHPPDDDRAGRRLARIGRDRRSPASRTDRPTASIEIAPSFALDRADVPAKQRPGPADQAGGQAVSGIRGEVLFSRSVRPRRGAEVMSLYFRTLVVYSAWPCVRLSVHAGRSRLVESRAERSHEARG